ncbi:hypothetical protein FC82_GL001262 [Secundilactobacillus collinoides DSM 20515 = JCM 1123]|uniref:Uncharacterized protein n=1 Tax=Secundilactobacillus collinoides DSM 20515 = JCM 1123 TaxID=1423733 RepID=A0A0R2BBD8_SECCO|nr:hypothetical protein FC82_GL001262 [Secundilactobacillus collinoides DSM 20515 = JCM 1123]
MVIHLASSVSGQRNFKKMMPTNANFSEIFSFWNPVISVSVVIKTTINEKNSFSV